MKTTKKTSSKPKKSSRPQVSYPRIASDAFVTQKRLYSVRDELTSHADKKFHEVKSEFHGVKSEIHELKAEVATLNKFVHRMGLLVEEQNNRNKIVLDGLTQLFEKQERLEKKVESNY